ncbi:MAG: hypothetical protein KDD11_18815, partial [Acidobacteria bacterium]|nr:hypothetical protein [Acidobacteriota bacterium]
MTSVKRQRSPGGSGASPGGRSLTPVRSALARWGLLATTLILGVTLIATTWATHRSIVRASTQLTRSEGEALAASIRRDLREVRPPLSDFDLEAVLHGYRGDGLRYVAIYDPRRGDVMVSAGTAVGPEPQPALGLEGQRWVEVDGVYHLVVPANRRPPAPEDAEGRRPPEELRPRPPRRDRNGPPPRRDGGRPPRRFDDDQRPAGPRDDGGPLETDTRDPADGRPPAEPRDLWLILEAEASTAPILRQQTTGALATGAVSALVLMLAGLVFWRQARARERVQQQLEHQKRLSTLGEMSAVLAHEIRNPLASLKGHTQLLAERIGDEHPESKRVQRIVGEAVRLEKLTTDLLAFVRSGTLDRQPTDPAALIAELREEEGAERIRVDRREAPATWSLDRARLRQVLSNLLRNALDASPPEAPVDVRVRAGGPSKRPELRITVRDRGPGLPAGHEQEIFEPFFTT